MVLTIIAALAKMLGSNAIGSVIGWFGGFLQRKQDLAGKKLDLEFESKKLIHEIDLRRIDIEIMDREIAGKEKIASIETDGQVAVAQLQSITEGQKVQFEGDGKMAAFSKFIRPAITLWFVLASSILAGAIIYLGVTNGVNFTITQWADWVEYAMVWVFFQAGVTIGWWFAMRSGQPPTLGKK